MLAQRLQLLALTQRDPRAVLGAQRGLGRCWAGTYTHTHRKRQAIRGRGSSRGSSGGQCLPGILRGSEQPADPPHSDPEHAQAQALREPETIELGHGSSRQPSVRPAGPMMRGPTQAPTCPLMTSPLPLEHPTHSTIPAPHFVASGFLRTRTAKGR